MHSFTATLAFLLVTLAGSASAFCWQAGYNPGFTDKPTVQQVRIDVVRVIWKDIVKNRDCADQFLVKYWPRSSPQEYITSELVGIENNYLDVKVTPKIMYQFQAVAREDKGLIRGIDWNKSPIVEFKTSSYNKELAGAEGPAPEVIEGLKKTDDSEGGKSSAGNPNSLPSKELYENILETSGQPDVYGDDEIRIAGLSIEMFVGAVVGGLVVILIVVGIIYKVATSGKKKDYDVDDDDDDSNSSDGDEEKEEMEPEKNIP